MVCILLAGGYSVTLVLLSTILVLPGTAVVLPASVILCVLGFRFGVETLVDRETLLLELTMFASEIFASRGILLYRGSLP